jgi:hypothetical protein
VRNHFATASQYALASPRYDLDANGAVDMADIAIAVRNGFARRSADEVSGLLVAASTSTTSGGSPAAEAVVRRVGLSGPAIAVAGSRSQSRHDHVAAVDAIYGNGQSGDATANATTTTLRASRARRLLDSDVFDESEIR